MEAVVIIAIGLLVAAFDHLWHKPRRPKGAHALGWPTPDNHPTYHVMQRQFVRRRLGHKVRIYVPARTLT